MKKTFLWWLAGINDPIVIEEYVVAILLAMILITLKILGLIGDFLLAVGLSMSLVILLHAGGYIQPQIGRDRLEAREPEE